MSSLTRDSVIFVKSPIPLAINFRGFATPAELKATCTGLQNGRLRCMWPYNGYLLDTFIPEGYALSRL
jgi:hypothetical protein